ncbi:MAG: hypothetical protein KJ709_05745 [Nanoarchaeota archaeon]|nr:hypothetical protein [Nanoarchaeota archaeon]
MAIDDTLAPENEGEDLERKVREEEAKQKQRQAASDNSMWGSMFGFSVPDILFMGATTAAGLALGGGILNLATTTLSYLVGAYVAKKGKMSKQDFKDEVNTGNILTGALWPAYQWLDSIANPLLMSVVGLGVIYPLINATFIATRYMVKNYDPQQAVNKITSGEILKLPGELYGELKRDFVPSLKEGYKYLTLPILATWHLVPLAYQLPAIAGFRAGYRVIMEKTTGAAGSAKNAAKGIGDAARNAGRRYQPSLDGAY